jgi:DNA ligase-1
MITRPLLAGKAEMDKITYPCYVTPKLDGVRALKVDGKFVTRKFKHLPNTYLREKFERLLPDGIDGELMFRDKAVTLNKIQSAVMSFDGQPDIVFNAFDYVKDDLDKPYLERIGDLQSWYLNAGSEVHDNIEIIAPVGVVDQEDLLAYEDKTITQGYEGVMIRAGEGRYKCGRSTTREGILVKLKRFNDSEALVIGFQEGLHNTNEQEKDEFGLAKRSSKKAGMVGADTLGKFNVRFLENEEIEFEIGTGQGLTHELRKQIWENQDEYLGKIIKFKYQQLSPYGVPLIPIFLGFRDPRDMS